MTCKQGAGETQTAPTHRLLAAGSLGVSERRREGGSRTVISRGHG